MFVVYVGLKVFAREIRKKTRKKETFMIVDFFSYVLRVLRAIF